MLIGWGSGVGIQAVMRSLILKQTEPVVQPFQSAAEGVSKSDFFTQHPWFAAHPWVPQAILIFGAAVALIGTVAVLFYFFFSLEHKRTGKTVSKIGVLFLMVSFGASFGYTVMGRVSLLIGRVQFLLYDWLKIAR